MTAGAVLITRPVVHAQYSATALNTSLDFTESWNYTLAGLAPNATYGSAAVRQGIDDTA